MNIMDLMRLGAKMPEYNPNYSYHVEWLYEEDNRPNPHCADFPTVREAINSMVGIVNAPKTLTHISMSRRNA